MATRSLRRFASAVRTPATRFILTVGVFWGSLYLFVPVLAPAAAGLGAGVGAVGLVLASYGFAEFLFRVPLGIWSDRIARRLPFMRAAFVLAALAALGMAVSPDVAVLGAFRGLTGVAASAWVPIALLAVELFPPERTAWALGMVNFAAGAGTMVAFLVSGALAQWGGFTAVFAGSGILALAGALLTLTIREPAVAARRERPSVASQLAVARRPGVLTASVLAIIQQYVMFSTVYGFIPLVAAERFHATGGALGVLTFVLVAPSTAMPLIGARLAERYRPRTALLPGYLTAAAATALLPWAGTVDWLALGGIVVGMAMGMMTPVLMSSAVEAVPAAERGSAMGFYQAIYALGSFSGPMVAGFVGGRFGFAAMFGSIALVAVVGAAIVWRRL